MRRIPKSISQALAKFGNNPQGQNVYRVVWSEDRTQWEYGEQKRKYGTGLNRFVLEKWCPPEMYQPDMWPEEILGPFPRKGDYEHCYTVQTPDGEFVSVEAFASVIDLICRCIEAGKMQTRSARWVAIKEAQAKKEAAEKQRFDDIWEDAQGPFQGNAVSGIPSKRRPEDVRLDLTTKDIPIKNLPRQGFKQL